MLTKFDSKSNRVKGLSFHPKRPWILASLHNGVIQLWDYRMGVLLDRYEEHDGPVRGIDFHKLQPLFVSGGDDYKIKVWNYKLRRCLFTLLGHLDYIRTVQFHNEYPWIVSASDDQTIRIWNWQSRTCISVLTGHNHYVMCANFHPRDDLIVSASLDQTVRVWDTSGLRRKTVRGAPSTDTDTSGGRLNSDLFGQNDAVVKYVLEGHDRGVNWASFHPTQSLIISGADDRQVKLWRMSDAKAWEMDTLRGHTNNVSCVMFHPKHDLAISNSEDRSIRVWDIQKRMSIQTFRRENDRFWMLAVHPEQSLIAAGHDSGMVVFKLERERPAYAGSNGQIFYVRDRFLRHTVLGVGTDVPLMSLRSRTGIAGLGTAPRTLLVNPYNPSEDNIIVVSSVDGGTYELYNMNSSNDVEPARGSALACAFTARNKFASLGKDRHIVVRGLNNDAGKKVKPPYATADYIFAASTPGRILCRADDRICLFELQSRRVVAEISGVVVKYICWNQDGSLVALMAKHAIVIADRELSQICSVTETVRVKSGVWDDNGVFIYTTLNHVKYVLPIPSADNGIVRTLEQPVYATECKSSMLYILTRESKNQSITIDPTEHLFKLALARRQFDKVLQIIRSSRLCGQSVVAYLQKAGYPEIALFFVEDDMTKFNLALECGNLDIALKAAKAVNTEESWGRLAQEALRQGNFDIVEQSYQIIKAFDKLSFLYLITGHQEKLGKMLAIANKRGDIMSRFHNSLYSGNVEERIKVLETAGQTALAYVTAATYGFSEDATRLRTYLEEAKLPVPDIPVGGGKPAVLLPPTPIYRDSGNWPTVPVSKGAFDPATIAEAAASGESLPSPRVLNPEEPPSKATAKQVSTDTPRGAGEAWEMDLGLGGEAAQPASEAWEMDLGLEAVEVPPPKPATAGSAGPREGFSMPTGGTSVASYWVQNSTVAGDHAAAGSFETAMQLLNRQIGVVNFAPFRGVFLAVYQGARASTPSLPSIPSLGVFITRNDLEQPPPKDRTLPAVCVALASVQERVRAVYKAFQDGKFNACSELLDELFTLIPLVVVSLKEHAAEVKNILKIAAEYKLAVRIMLAAKSHDQEDAVRQMELGAYMTHCALEPAHLLLALNLAMSVTFKFKNFIHAAAFAKRVLEMPDINSAKNQALATKAKKVLQLSEQEARNAHRINYDDRTPFHICAASLTPIYRGNASVKSPYSGAAYLPEYKGTICAIDGVSQVGLETIGLVSASVSTR